MNIAKINPRILLSGATILTAVVVIIGVTFAFFSDTETSADNTFQGGVLDLQIDNTSYYNGEESPNTTWELDDLDEHLFFNFLDLKPGDWGEDTISIHVDSNDSWGCFDSTLTSNDDVSSNEPELLDGDSEEDAGNDFDGELGENVNFVFWVDDGDNVLENNEDGENIIVQGPANEVLDGLSVTLADAASNLFEEDGPLQGLETYYIAKAWCFGDLTLNPLSQDGEGPDSPRNPANSSGGIACDGTGLDNTTQSDVFTADITFSTEQFRNNPDFLCSASPTPSTTITPTPIVSCTDNDAIYAASVGRSVQGLRKNGTAVLLDRSDPTDALGAPQSTGAASDSPVVAGSFFSLGFPHANNGNTPGTLVLDMGEAFFPNPGGDDLFIYEVTGGTYPDETISIEAKLNIADAWTPLGTVSRDGGIEISPLTSARYVRIQEASNITPFEPTADGYDLDAVQAFCTVPEIN